MLSRFAPFQIEFFLPKFFKVNCVKLLAFHPQYALSVYRGIEMTTQEIVTVYEWKLNLSKTKSSETGDYGNATDDEDEEKLNVCLHEVSPNVIVCCNE